MVFTRCGVCDPPWRTPGENFANESYNGMPFEVTVGWLEEVPNLGFFITDFVTRARCASLRCGPWLEAVQADGRCMGGS